MTEITDYAQELHKHIVDDNVEGFESLLLEYSSNYVALFSMVSKLWLCV